MAGKLSAFFSIPEALKVGKIVANPVAWKTGQVTAGVLATCLGTIVAILPLFGYQLDIDDVTLNSIAGGILAAYGVFNKVVTVVTTEKIGVKS